jgi:hypothetical protein
VLQLAQYLERFALSNRWESRSAIALHSPGTRAASLPLEELA